MTIKQLLNETKRKLTNRIYSDTDTIARKLGNFIHLETKDKDNRRGSFTLNITDIIPKSYNPFNRKIILKLSNTRISKRKIENHAYSDGKTVTLILNWIGDFNTNWKVRGFSQSSLVVLKHELVHILDFLEMTNDEINNSNRERGKVEIDNSVTYYKDPYEFNQLINVIKEYKRLYPKSWEKINSFDRIYGIIDKHGQGYHPVDDSLKTNYDFKMKLKTRLKKDDLIPPLLKGKRL